MFITLSLEDIESKKIAFKILGTPKCVLSQTVKPQMKCRIMGHFIRVFTACSGKKN